MTERRDWLFRMLAGSVAVILGTSVPRPLLAGYAVLWTSQEPAISYGYERLSSLVNSRTLTLGDVDEDGALELLVRLVPRGFSIIDYASGYVEATFPGFSGPWMIDIDGDGDLEVLAQGVGEIGLIDFEGVAASPAPDTAPPTTLLATTPNPGSGPMTFLLQVGATSVVSVKVIDIAGRVVWASRPEQLAPGQRSILWPGTDRRGALVASGVYYYEVKQADRVLGTGKLVVRH